MRPLQGCDEWGETYALTYGTAALVRHLPPGEIKKRRRKRRKVGFRLPRSRTRRKAP